MNHTDPPMSEPKIMGDDGQFHATDEAIDLSGTTPEAWVALVFFWMLGATVFYQFFTRYVLNNSAAWTEEIARYLLIACVFTGATIGVIKNNHIQEPWSVRSGQHGFFGLVSNTTKKFDPWWNGIAFLHDIHRWFSTSDLLDHQLLISERAQGMVGCH